MMVQAIIILALILIAAGLIAWLLDAIFFRRRR